MSTGPGTGEWDCNGPASLSMSVDMHNLVSSAANSLSPDCEHGERPCKVGLQEGEEEEEEVSYEGFGYADEDADSPEGRSSAPSPTGPNLPRSARSSPCTIGRHSWLRTSLKRTPTSSGKKRLSSNALASQLYRSGSFNSSGRGSTCDTADDTYSDVSLEADVIDLNHRVQMIQEQMHALADTQNAGEERYTRARQEAAALQARILMMEEAARDAEARNEERLQAEQRRHREWAGRLERERQLQLENYAIRLQAAELESTSLREEGARLREQLERSRVEREDLEESVAEARREVRTARDAERQALGRAAEAHGLLEAAREELAVRAEEQRRIDELVHQVTELRARNKGLEESRDELQAAVALQAGRELLRRNPCNTSQEDAFSNNDEPSLAEELQATMTQEQMRQALREQQEVNNQLRAYIDGILLNIVENYPQLLEVKHTSS